MYPLEEKKSKPYKVERKPLKIEVKLDGFFVADQMEQIALRPEVWTRFKVLKAVADKHGHAFGFQEGLIGGAAIDATGSALPEDTLEMCQQSDAVFLAAVGDPKYDGTPVRPEQGLLALRKGLGAFANLRPVKLYKELLHASTIKAEVIKDVDLLVVRELTGGIYFGERGRKTVDGIEGAYDTMFYTVPEVERVVRLAFELARRLEVDVLKRGRIAQLRGSQPPGELTLLAGDPLTVDHQPYPLFEAQLGIVARAKLLGEGLGHVGHLHRAHLVQGLLGQHSISFSA